MHCHYFSCFYSMFAVSAYTVLQCTIILLKLIEQVKLLAVKKRLAYLLTLVYIFFYSRTTFW